MNFYDSAYWDVERSVGAKVGRDDNSSVESYVYAEVGSGDEVEV